MRTERDVIGEVQIDDSIYYGINTLRAKNNFNISGIKSRDRDHIRAMAIVKKGAAYANYTSGKLQKELYESINKACDRLIAGEFDDQFVLDVFQAGAGTSFNMNTNEILANLVLESLNHKKGEYKYAHPNDVINMSQFPLIFSLQHFPYIPQVCLLHFPQLFLQYLVPVYSLMKLQKV